jgi:hypothetical protein
MADASLRCKPRKSLAKAIGLTMRLLALVLVVLVLALLGGCQQRGSTGAAVPDFIQVGKVYDFISPPGGIKEGRVLEIRSDGWIRVQVGASDRVYWVNVNQVILVEEVKR